MGSFPETYNPVSLYLCTIFQCSFFICVPYFSLAEKVNELQELLNKKDQEMKGMEDRYKKYLEKAKSVSKSLWASV